MFIFKDEIKTYVTQHDHKQEIVLDTLIETILKDFRCGSNNG